MGKTSIAWTDHTVNPIRFRNLETGKVGHYCEKLSAGCANCYASQMQRGPYLSGLEYKVGNRWRGELFFDERVLEQVLKRRKPTKFFWCDMTDLFGSWVPSDWITKCLRVMNDTPQHTHQILTKRAKRMYETFRFGTPSPNVWLGVSVENQAAADERIPFLLETPAAVRFLSCEPLLGPIDARTVNRSVHHESVGCDAFRVDTWDKADWSGIRRRRIDWIIIGCESFGGRLCDESWIRSLISQTDLTDVACFVKQLRINGKVSTNPIEWPEWARIQEFPAH